MAEVVSLAERLRDRRSQLGISQSQAARELDVARTAYRLWEMEAARPAPDRWRIIARWLGISISTLLMAEELMTNEEAESRGALLARFDSDVESRPSAAERGEFFPDARGLLTAAVAGGELSDAAAEEMHAILDRIEEERTEPETIPWEATEMLRDLPADDRAAVTARSGLRFVAAGIPAGLLDEAERLTEDLVERAVAAAADEGDASVGVSIVVGRERLRVEVLDAIGVGTTTPDAPRTGEFPVLHGSANRWGGGATERGRRVTWFEIDLPSPGDIRRAEDGS